MQRRGPGDRCIGVIVRLVRPAQRAGERVDGIDARQQVAEVHEGRAGVLARRSGRLDDYGRAHFRRGAECPADAAGFFVERVNGAVLAADVDGAIGDRRLGTRALRVRECESPLQFEPGQVLDGQLRIGCGNVPRAFRRDSPAGRRRSASRIELRGRAGALWCARRRDGVVATEIRRHLLLLGGRELLGVAAHDAGVERRIDGVRRHHLQEHLVRRLRHLAQMARRAILGEKRLPRMLRIRRLLVEARRRIARAFLARLGRRDRCSGERNSGTKHGRRKEGEQGHHVPAARADCGTHPCMTSRIAASMRVGLGT